MFVGVAEGAGIARYTAGVECSSVGLRPILPLSPGGGTSVAGAILYSLSGHKYRFILRPLFVSRHERQQVHSHLP